jgi:SAM-dependent methyltransferase
MPTVRPTTQRLAALWTWPLPAVLTWLVAWLVFRALVALSVAPAMAIGLATGTGVMASLAGDSWWRRLLIAGGFPLSLALSMPSLGLLDLPAWAWLLPPALLVLIYPLNAWRDAPLFPTPHDALGELPKHAPLAAGVLILDAGCGAGDGLLALRRAYPDARLFGLEWSWPLRAVSALRCPWATVRRGDMWRADWSGYDMVYLFQRPESMGRAAEKAATLRDGAWLVSLEFEATQLEPNATFHAPGGRMVWLYRAPFVTRR